VYRLPLVFTVPAGCSDEEMRAVFRRALVSSPTLCARYSYDPARDEFFQSFDPDLANLEITDAGDVSSLEDFCRLRWHMPDLGSGGPLAAAFITCEGRRLLFVEFHHVAIDGVGVALFERLLGGLPVKGLIDDPVRAFAVYDDIAAREKVAARVSEPPSTLLPFMPSGDPTTSPTPALVARESTRLDADGVAAVLSASARQHVFPRVLMQAAFECALARVAPGVRYSAVNNWRWTVGERGAMGSFPALIDHPVGDVAALGARARSLMATHGSPEMEPSDRLDDRPAVVFSFEQFGFESARFFPVDEYPRFELYQRVVFDRAECLIEVEYDRRVVPQAVASALVDDIGLTAARSNEETG